MTSARGKESAEIGCEQVRSGRRAVPPGKGARCRAWASTFRGWLRLGSRAVPDRPGQQGGRGHRGRFPEIVAFNEFYIYVSFFNWAGTNPVWAGGHLAGTAPARALAMR